jgi:hypothetical protein
MGMSIVAARPARIALGVAGGLVVALVVAQLVLPGIAARIARDQIGKYGAVRSVSVRAFPAIELLWGHAESASVRAGDLRMSVSQLNGLLPRTRGIQRLELNATSLQVGPMRLREVSVEKLGEEVEVRGRIEQADVQRVLPAGVQAQLVENAQGAVEVRVGGSLFGVGASMLATLSAQDGKLVAQPQGFPFAGLARLTVFSDPRLFVQSVGLRSQRDAAGGEVYVMTLRARLR